MGFQAGAKESVPKLYENGSRVSWAFTVLSVDSAFLS
jgi:hypothetical protein